MYLSVTLTQERHPFGGERVNEDMEAAASVNVKEEIMKRTSLFLFSALVVAATAAAPSFAADMPAAPGTPAVVTHHDHHVHHRHHRHHHHHHHHGVKAIVAPTR